MKKILKCIAALIATTVAFSTCASLASCGGSGNDNALVLFVNNGDKFDGVSKDRIWTKLEEKAGVELKFNGTAHSSSYYTHRRLYHRYSLRCRVLRFPLN